MAAVRELSMHEEQRTSSAVYEKGSETSLKSKKFISRDVEFTFAWNKFNLSLIGLWPDQSSKRSQASLITRYRSPILSVWLFTFVLTPQALAPFAYTFVFSELIDVITNTLILIGVIVRIIVLWHNGEVLALCLSFLTEDWTRRLSSQERELMMKNARLGRRISIGLTILVQGILWSFIIIKVLMQFSQKQSRPLLYLNIDVQNSTISGKYLLAPGYFPFDLSKLLNFTFIWSVQLVGVIVSTISLSSVDCFVAILIIHLCGQITVLRHALVNIIDDNMSQCFETFRGKLAVIVKRHNTLIRLAKVIKDSVNSMLLVLLLVYMFQLGLQLFGLLIIVTERKPGQFPFVQIVFFVLFYNYTIMNLLLYCYIGDMLMEESQALGLASYSCKWYNLSGSEAKDLILVIHRTSVPLQIWAGKFVPFSLELFGNVLKTSMTYFSVMLTMTE